MFPKSVTDFKINLIGVLGYILGVCFLIKHPLTSPAMSLFFLMLCWIIPVLILETMFLPHVKAAISKPPLRLDFKLAAIRYLGLLITLSVIALLYWIFPEYHDAFYKPWWNFLSYGLPLVLVLALPYFLRLGPNVAPEQDGYYQLGMLIFGQTRQLNKSCLIQYSLGWLVKMFFLPLMISYCWGSLKAIEGYSRADLLDSLSYCFSHLIHPSTIDYTTNFLSNNFGYLFNFAWVLVFLLDLAVGCVGYITSLRLFDTQIRSTEPTMLGWFVALQCYAPFNTLFSNSYFAYDRDNLAWGVWLAKDDITYVIWGSTIILLCIIYVAATVAFGLRFSNLTNRGIVTDGPYRYLKHPAYLSKNLSWWMISIPFITITGHYSDAIRNMFMLLGVNFVYFMRAKTEEWHLSSDPAYQAYSKAIAEHGLFAKIKKWFRFKPSSLPNIQPND